MPYTLKFYIYLCVVWTFAIVILMRWVNQYGLLANLLFAAAFSYLAIPFRRWLFGRKNL